MINMKKLRIIFLIWAILNVINTCINTRYSWASYRTHCNNKQLLRLLDKYTAISLKVVSKNDSLRNELKKCK
jgi:hypothetical protein